MTNAVPCPPARPIYSDEELIWMLQDFAAKLGRVPSLREIDHQGEIPHAAVYARRFGSWGKALEAADLRAPKQ